MEKWINCLPMQSESRTRASRSCALKGGIVSWDKPKGDVRMSCDELTCLWSRKVLSYERTFHRGTGAKAPISER